MSRIVDIFNGDADGVCALIQWRKAYPQVSALVSGVKRDNALLRKVEAGVGDQLLVLDINFEKNRDDVRRLLAAGASIRYFDHHYPGQVIDHERLLLTIDESPMVCTSLLVNDALNSAQWPWAVVGAFGDNLPVIATDLAKRHGVADTDIAALRKLGELLNYNGYGSSLADLHFDPVSLFETLYTYGDPLSFVRDSACFTQLAAGYAADMAEVGAVIPVSSSAGAAAYVLPDEPWSRRVIGVWANDLSQRNKARAHLVLCPDGNGAYTASIRAAQNTPTGAAAFCREFPGGGGRESAGGINGLAANQLESVVSRFMSAFSAD